MKKIDIVNRNNQKLSAIIDESDINLNKLIIFSHSFKGDKNYQPIINQFSLEVIAAGYSLLRFDFLVDQI